MRNAARDIAVITTAVIVALRLHELHETMTTLRAIRRYGLWAR